MLVHAAHSTAFGVPHCGQLGVCVFGRTAPLFSCSSFLARLSHTSLLTYFILRSNLLPLVTKQLVPTVTSNLFPFSILFPVKSNLFPPLTNQPVPIANKPNCPQIPLARTKYYYQPVPRSHRHAPNTITNLFPDPTVTHQILLPPCSQIPLSRTKYYCHPVPISHCHAPNNISLFLSVK